MRRSLRASLALLVAVMTVAACQLVPVTTPTPTPTPTATPTPVASRPPSPTSPPARNGGEALAGLPSLADVVARATPAVVAVATPVPRYDFFGRIIDMEWQTSGTGFIISPDGYVLTNNHVVQGARAVQVVLANRDTRPATVVGSDSLIDLAVLKIEGEGLPTLPLGDASALPVGDWVIAIGNALALPGGPTVTVGVVSALDRTLQTDPGSPPLENLIQTDATINPGNSGGPLVNLQGEVVGINTAVIRGAQAEGLGFAVSIDVARAAARQIIETGRVAWPYLGIAPGELNPAQAEELGLEDARGVLVLEVVGQPAARAGIQPGDVIVGLDSHPVPTTAELTRLLRTRFRVGQAVQVRLLRDGREVTVTATLGERPTSR